MHKKKCQKNKEKKPTKWGIEWKSAKNTETIDSNAKEKQIVFLYKIKMNNKSRKHTQIIHTFDWTNQDHYSDANDDEDISDDFHTRPVVDHNDDNENYATNYTMFFLYFLFFLFIFFGS